MADLDIWRKVLDSSVDSHKDADVTRLAEELVERSKPT